MHLEWHGMTKKEQELRMILLVSIDMPYLNLGKSFFYDPIEDMIYPIYPVEQTCGQVLLSDYIDELY